MTFTLREIEACTGGRLIGGDPAAQVFSITTDSRTLSPGELFVALKGEHFDGHAFLEVAAASGAGAALVSEAPAISGLPLIVVNDTLKALGDIAAHIRDTLNPTVVGITGSTGKTTVKELCASILQLGGKCLKTAKNFNNLVGLPLNLLRLEPDHRFCVLEMGSSCPGEIRRLSHIARPEASVITNINPAHLNGLGSIEGIIREKQDIFCHTSRVAVINPSLEHMRQLTIPAGLDVVTFSAEAPADVCLAEIHAQGLNGTELSLDIAGQVIRTRLRLPGRHNVLNALAAAALAHALGLDHQSIAAGLRQAKGPHMRSEIIVLDHLTLINDSYNARPASNSAGASPRPGSTSSSSPDPWRRWSLPAPWMLACRGKPSTRPPPSMR